MRCPFIHLKFRHWSLDGSTFVAQAPQFSWTTQFRNGYCTACVDTRRSAISYLCFGTCMVCFCCTLLLIMKLSILLLIRPLSKNLTTVPPHSAAVTLFKQPQNFFTLWHTEGIIVFNVMKTTNISSCTLCVMFPWQCVFTLQSSWL